MSNSVIITQLTVGQVATSAIGALVGAFVLAFIAFSFWVAWKKQGYRLVFALAIFFTVLAFNQTLTTITSFGYLLNSTEIRIIPFQEYRQVLLSISAVYVFYALWRRNNKTEKIMNLHNTVTEAMKDTFKL